MHVRLLLTAGAAATSLIAGTAGSVILGHATPAPNHRVVQPQPHHLSNAHHSGTTKNNTGSVAHRHNGTKGNLKSTGHKGKPKPKPTGTPKPTPTPTPHP